MLYVGIDVHKEESQICILEEDKRVRQLRIKTTKQRLEAVFGQMERSRLLLESSTESEWVARCLESLGHEVIVADPNFAAMYATRSRRVKTDQRGCGGKGSESLVAAPSASSSGWTRWPCPSRCGAVSSRSWPCCAR